jgi:predicted GNAT family acetyltransferase
MDVTVRDVPDHKRYEAHLGDDLAGFIDYEPGRQLASAAWPRHGAGSTDDDSSHGTVRVLVHTEVLDAFGGKGIGSALARYALDDLRERDIKARVLCPFIKSWIERHPAYQDQG